MSALKDMQKKDVTDLSNLEMCILVTHDPGRYDGYYVQPSVAAAELARLQAIEAAALKLCPYHHTPLSGNQHFLPNTGLSVKCRLSPELREALGTK